MTIPATGAEEAGLNVYWKIKNFSYCCEQVTSPTFNYAGYPYSIRLSLTSNYASCQLLKKVADWKLERYEKQISILRCDGSSVAPMSSNSVVSRDLLFGKRNVFLPEDTLTIRFRTPTKYERGKLFIHSQIGVNRKCFLWTLPDFCKVQHFAVKPVEKSEVYGFVGLSLQSMSGNNPTDQYSVEVVRSGGERCYCVLKISTMRADGKSVKQVTDEFVFEKVDARQTRGFPMIIKKSELFACKSLLLPDDTLTLKCDFAMSLGKVIDGTSVMRYCEDSAVLLKESDHLSMDFRDKNDSRRLTELQSHFKSLLDDGTLHDVSLVIGAEAIKAHKNILSARSSVFRELFTIDKKRALSDILVIEDLDVETVRGLLLYMYTDTINNYQWGSMKKLYLASSKYEVLGLKEKCVSFLETNLSVSNACDSLILADSHQDSNLRTAVLDFISENGSAVFDSESWKELETCNSSLALKSMREICCNKQFR